MKVQMIEFPHINFFCVGTDMDINIINQYCNIQKETYVVISKLINRMEMNQIYAFCEHKKWAYFLESKYWNQLLKKKQLLIGKSDFFDALFMSYTDKLSEFLGIPEEEKKEMIADSVWNELFKTTKF